MCEKGLLDSVDVVMHPLFTKEIIAFSNTSKLEPLPIEINWSTLSWTKGQTELVH